MSGFGDKVREQLKSELGQVDIPVRPTTDPGAGEKQGEEFGGAFGDTARSRIDAALKDLPNPKLDVDSSEADTKIAELRARLEELRDKRIGVDISADEALAEMAAIKADLDELGSKSPNVQVKVDALKAAADLAGIRAEVTALDGKNVDIKVDDNGSAEKASGNINALLLAGISLGPAIIPVAAAVAAAIGAIGIGAIAGVAGLGVLKLAFGGIGTAVSALQTQQTQQGQNSAQLAAQQISSANSVASAQDGVRNAVQGVQDAERAASIANTNAEDAVATARRGVQDAYTAAGISIQSALDAQTRAEQTLEQAERSELTAQQAVTDARQAAQRQLESYTTQMADGALAERQAQLSIQQAKQSLDTTLANPTATNLQKQQAQLAYDQAVQQLTDVQQRNQFLAQDKAAADKAGVDGSKQVVAAQNSLVSATQAVGTAQQGVKTASANVAEVQRSNTEKITVAEQNLTKALAAQQETARAGAESVAKAQDQVTAAQRSLTGALAQAAAQAATVSSAATAVQTAMNALGPAGQEFARFIVSLKPQMDALRNTAEAGLFPGVEAGIKSMLPLLPQLNSLVGVTAKAMGDLAAKAGAALNSPYWRQFFAFVQGEIGPSFRAFGTILGDVEHGFVGLLEAFKPVWDQMGTGLESLTARFAAFGQSAGQNPAFQQFLTYVKTEGPVVVSLLGSLLLAFSRIGEALGPLGGIVLGLVNSLAKFIAVIPINVLQIVVTTLWLGYEAWKAWQIITVITGAITAFKEAEILSTITSAARTVATWAQTAAMAAASAATSVWTGVQWLLNAALTANPIGIVIVAVAALAAGVIYAYTHFQTFRDIVNGAWQIIKDATNVAWNGVIKPVFDAFVAGIHLIGDSFNWVIGVIQTAWNKLGDIAKAPVNFVIDTVYNHGIVAVWNGIAGVFGLGTLQPAALLAEGGVIPGYSPGVDTVPAMLSRGEGILVPEAVRGLGPQFVYAANSFYSGGRATGSGGGSGFAGGGVVGAVGGAVAGAWDAISGVFTDPVGTITKLFSGVTGSADSTPGGGLWHQALVAIPKKIIDAIVEKAKALVTSIGSALTGGGPAELDGWITTALGLMGLPLTYLPGIHSLILHESGGNPNAINLTDSNAAAGHPSQGLMQTIPSTYAAYVLPALAAQPITNPISNITAGVRYALANYGPGMLLAGGNHDASGNYIGYDSGGMLPPGLTLAYNGTSTSEHILTGDQFSNLAGRTSGDGGQQPVVINVYPRADHSEADIADMVSRRLSLALRATV